ncbi:MAG: hypothetical protein QW304_08890 [Thermoproteota archaeon]
MGEVSLNVRTVTEAAKLATVTVAVAKALENILAPIVAAQAK